MLTRPGPISDHGRMALLAWFAKPFLYVALCIAGAKLFASYGPHHKAPTWLVVALATIGRMAAGVPGGILATGSLGHDESLVAFTVVIFALGFALWLGTAKLAFPKTPPARLAAFAAVAEILIATIDVLAWKEARSISFC